MRSGQNPPTIEMEVEVGSRRSVIGAIEPHDMVILILRPDPSHEPALAGARIWGHIKYQTTNISEKFSPNVIKAIVLLVESVRIQVDHLQKATRQKPDAKD